MSVARPWSSFFHRTFIVAPHHRPGSASSNAQTNSTSTPKYKVPTMKFLIKAAVIAAALGASAAASATEFDFSYTFTDGQQITGSLDGTLSGTSISNISDLQVSLNGIAFSGGSDSSGATTLGIYGYDASTGIFDAPATFSTVSSKNNFDIADEPQGNNANYS